MTPEIVATSNLSNLIGSYEVGSDFDHNFIFPGYAAVICDDVPGSAAGRIRNIFILHKFLGNGISYFEAKSFGIYYRGTRVNIFCKNLLITCNIYKNLFLNCFKNRFRTGKIKQVI